MNEQNLKSFADRSPEERRALARQGGMASGVARKERKRLRDELTALLSAGDTQERLCAALIERATNGDSRAFSVIRDTIGEKVAEEIDITSKAFQYGEDIRRQAAEIYRHNLETGTERNEAVDAVLTLEEKRAIAGEHIENLLAESRSLTTKEP